MFMKAYRRRRLAQKVQSLVPPPDGDDMDRQNANKLIRVVSAQHAKLCSEHGANDDVDLSGRIAEARNRAAASVILTQELTAYRLNVVMRSANVMNPSFAEFYRTVEKVIRSIERNCP